MAEFYIRPGIIFAFKRSVVVAYQKENPLFWQLRKLGKKIKKFKNACRHSIKAFLT